VITTASSKEKLDFLHGMPKGSTHGVNYREQNFAEEVAEITGQLATWILFSSADFKDRRAWRQPHC
jgi:NADPH-dependent curcumin reductase CurA